jgi:hypothetical protein
MPTLEKQTASKAIKLLYVGDSGTGKTGSLISLVQAGYNLRILDYDNGLTVLRKLIERETNAAELFKRVHYETLTDEYIFSGKKIKVKGVPTAFADGLQLLTNWKMDDYQLGKLTTWGEKDVLVIDTLTMLSTAALNYVLALAGRSGGKKEIQDYGSAMDKVEALLQMLYSDTIKCNVIVNSHLTFVEDSDGKSKGYPSAVGSKLSPKIPRYFNSTIQAAREGKKRYIYTQPHGAIELKNPDFLNIPEKLPLDTGLATFFKAIQS